MDLTALKRRLLCGILRRHRGDWEHYGGWAYLRCERCERLVHPISPRVRRRIARHRGGVEDRGD